MRTLVAGRCSLLYVLPLTNTTFRPSFSPISNQSILNQRSSFTTSFATSLSRPHHLSRAHRPHHLPRARRPHHRSAPPAPRQVLNKQRVISDGGSSTPRCSSHLRRAVNTGERYIRALRQRVKELEEEAKRDKAALRARRFEEPWAGTEDVVLGSAAKDLAAFFSRVHFGCLMGWGLFICRIHERYSLFVLFILAQPERHEVSVIVTVTREPRSAADP